jgi:predicted MPP superfamily phosphohydrolase
MLVGFLRAVSRTPGSFLVMLFVLASGFAHYLLYRWVRRAFPRLPQRTARVAVTLLWLFPLTARLVARRSGGSFATSLFAVGMLELVLLVVSVPLFLGLDLLARILTRRRKTRRLVATMTAETEAAPEPPLAPPPVGRREVIERAVGVTFLAGAGSMLGWGMVIGRHDFRIEEVPVRIAGLPRSLDGYTLVQISDLHVGAFVGDRDLDRGLELVRAAKPDVLLLTGDLVDQDAEYTSVLTAKLARMAAPRDGMVGILGNHDYYAGADQVAAAMRAAGVRMLVNEGMRLRPDDGGGFALLGIDDLWAQRSGGPGPRLDEAMRQVPPDVPRILLSHQPTFFYQAAPHVALQLSGHTHGGQVNPGVRIADIFMPFVAGRYERSGSTLWVNRGFGVSGPPSRVFAPPEVTKVVLVAA